MEQLYERFGEKWVKISWIPLLQADLYEVSSMGRVRNAKTKHVLRASEISTDDNPQRYAQVKLTGDGGSKHTLYVHRLVAHAFVLNDDPTTKTYVDHIDRCRTNNNYRNLRWSSPSQNSYNRGLLSTNKSGVACVHFRKGKYVAQMWYNRTPMHLGCFQTKREAALAVAAKKRELYKEFTPDHALAVENTPTNT